MGVVAALAGSACAQVLEEDFADPLGGWTQRWFYQNAVVDNYYVATGTCDPNYRGNNPCGLWFVDTQGCSTGAGGLTSEIMLDPGFGQTVQEIKFLVRCWVNATVTIKDMSGATIYTSPPVSNPQFPPCDGFQVQTTSTNGVRSILFTSSTGQIEGNTAIDDVVVVVGNPCYADCDSTTGPGVLDIFDFLCFQNRYSAGAPYACDCDTSTGPGVCDIFDFVCFQNEYAAGCP